MESSYWVCHCMKHRKLVQFCSKQNERTVQDSGSSRKAYESSKALKPRNWAELRLQFDLGLQKNNTHHKIRIYMFDRDVVLIDFFCECARECGQERFCSRVRSEHG
jgi:hypothetical protein